MPRRRAKRKDWAAHKARVLARTGGDPVKDMRPDSYRLVAWAARRAQDDFGYFLKWVKTIDEAEDNPRLRIKRFPADIPYIKYLSREMVDEPLLWVPKSRRLMLTWINAAFMVWNALQPGYHGFVQTRNEAQAAWLIKDRCWFIWEYLPTWLKYAVMKGTDAAHSYCKLQLPNGSKIWGVPQGPDQFRGYTATGVFIDEAAAHERLKDSLAAILPLREKGCRISIVSSAQPGYFAEVITKTPREGNVTTPMRGLRKWQLQNGGKVLEVHYTSDPHKDPDRDGALWVEERLAEYPGGKDGPLWRQEMEIDFHAYQGGLVFPDWDSSRHVVSGAQLEEWKRELLFHPGPWWRAMDYGVRNPFCCLWATEWTHNQHGPVYFIYREFYETGLPLSTLKEAIAGMGGPHEHYMASWIDPRSDRHEMIDSFSPFYLLNHGEYSMNVQKANPSKTAIELLRLWLFQGRLIVSADCHNFIKEIEHYRYEEWNTAAEQRHNPKEKPVKKEDHLMDALRYFANGVQWREPGRVEPVIPLHSGPTRRELMMMGSRGSEFDIGGRVSTRW